MCAHKERIMHMNITLSAPPQTVQIVRQWAEEEHTSLNQYIRDVLEEKARAIKEARKRKADDFIRFFQTHSVRMPKGWRFNREEANAR